MQAPPASGGWLPVHIHFAVYVNFGWCQREVLSLLRDIYRKDSQGVHRPWTEPVTCAVLKAAIDSDPRFRTFHGNGQQDVAGFYTVMMDSLGGAVDGVRELVETQLDDVRACEACAASRWSETKASAVTIGTDSPERVRCPACGTYTDHTKWSTAVKVPKCLITTGCMQKGLSNYQNF